MVCDIGVDLWFVIYIYALLFTWKSKKKRILEVASPSACAVALEEEGFKKNKFLPRVPELWHSAKSI